MKKLLIFLLTLLLPSLSVYSQPCLPNGIHFVFQSQVDNFHANYPGCTMIGGNDSGIIK